MRPLLLLFLLLSLGNYLVFTRNTDLTHVEENLLHSHLRNVTNLQSFYEKLIQSNGIDKGTDLKEPITVEDIQHEQFQNKV